MKKVYTNLIVLVLSLFVVLFILEIGTRLVAPQPLFDECDKRHPDWPRPMIISDDLLGHKMKANGTWCLYQPDTAEKITIHTNSKGMRSSTEYNTTKPEGVFRVLVFGDSFVWGENLHDHQTIQAQLQSELQQAFDKRSMDLTAEVLSFGVDSYGAQQSLFLYERRALEYDADVVLNFFYQNDFTDVYTASNARYPRPFVFVNKGMGNITFYPADVVAKMLRHKLGDDRKFKYFQNDSVKKPAFFPWPKRMFMSNSHAYQFADTAFTRARASKKLQDSDRLLQKLALSEQTIFPFFFTGDDDFVIRLKILSAVFDYFEDQARKNNSTFVLVNIPSVYQVQDKHRELLRKEMATLKGQQLPEFLKEPTNNYFLTLLSQKKNIPYIDLTQTAHKNQHSFYHKTDDHWNAHGVNLSAQHVTQELFKMNLIPTS